MIKTKDMYKLTIKWSQTDVLNRLIGNSNELNAMIKSVKGGVTYAQIVTPSGVTKDITKYFGF